MFTPSFLESVSSLPLSIHNLAFFQSTGMLGAWVIFIVFVLLMLALDLGVFHRKSHSLGFRESLGWSTVWITMGLSFSVLVYFAYDRHWFGLGMSVDPVDQMTNSGQLAATKYLTAYVVEKSLSVDNIFVIATVFGSLAIPLRYQHRVLFLGILGALIMRGAMIGMGAVLVHSFHWILYIFGGFLILTGLKMLFIRDKEEHPENNPVVRWARKFFPVTRDLHGQHFIVKAGGQWAQEGALPGSPASSDPVLTAAKTGAIVLTPLAIALLLVEVTDLIFAVDSIPAVFAITADPFIVFTSNVFAILGLRSLYFLLADLITRFRYLKPALSLVLILVGVKMLAAEWLKAWLGDAFNLTVLAVILGILFTGIVTSIILVKEDIQASPEAP